MIFLYLLLINTLLYFFTIGMMVSFKESPKWTLRYAWIPPYQLLIFALVVVLFIITTLYGIYNFFKLLINAKT